MYVSLSRFPSAANPLQDNNADSLVELQRQASQTSLSGVANGVTGGTVGTGSVANKKRQLRASRFSA
jgi:hypothetical protein